MCLQNCFILGKHLSDFIVLNKAKGELFLHKISHLSRTTWCTTPSHTPVMCQIPTRNKSHIAEIPLLSLATQSVPLSCSGGLHEATFNMSKLSSSLADWLFHYLCFFFSWLVKWSFKYLTDVLSFSRSCLYTC